MENTLLEIINALNSFRHSEKFTAQRKKLLNKNIKILITGDLNSGKSTLVNSFFKKELVPMDMEPCTSTFISISSDSLHESENVDAVVCKNRMEIFEANSNFAKDSSTDATLNHKIKVILDSYYSDVFGRDSCLEIIDSPGLNIDLITSIKVYKEKEEIDLILYLLTGENHLTLTGKEFLQEIQKDKISVYIIVNRMDLIRDKCKCKQEILKQLKSIGLHDSLVFFISAKQVLDGKEDSDLLQDYQKMERKLQEFVEKKRINKLLPAKLYLENYLRQEKESNLTKLSELQVLLQDVKREIQDVKKEYVKMTLMKMSFEDIDSRIEDVAKGISDFTKINMKEMLQDLELLFEAVEWEGAVFAWYYGQKLCVLSRNLSRSRVMHCFVYAQGACLKYLEPIYLTSGHLLPDISVQIDKVEIEEGLRMDLEIPEVKLNHYDILAVDQAQAIFLPAIGICSAGLYTMKDTLLKSFSLYPLYSGIFRNAKTIIITTSIAGMGAFLFLILYDAKGRLQKKIKEKISLEYSQSKFIDDTAEHISMKTRKVLRTSLWNLKSQHTICYTQNGSLLESLKEKHTQIQKGLSECQEFLTEISVLEHKLEQVVLS